MSEWPMVKLGDIMRKTKSIDPKKFPEKPFKLFSIPAYDSNSPEEILGKDIGSSKILLQNNDVVLSKIVPHIRRAWAIPCGKDNIGSSEWIVFNNERFAPDFLAEYLKSDIFHQQLLTTVAGVGGSLNRARPAAIANLKAPLPPLEEQKRIAEILQKSAESIKQIVYEIEALEKLSLSVVDHFIRDEVPDKQPLNELVDFHGGSTPSKKNKDFWTDNGICWFTSKDLKFDELADSLDHITKKATSETALKPVSEKKSIAISLRGMSLAHRVPMSIIPGNSCVNQDLKALIPKEDMDIYVLFTLLKREEKFLLTKVSSSAHGTRKLDFPYIKTLSVPKLKIDQICRLKQRLQGIQQLKNCLVRKLALLQELQRSLSARAFTGQL